MSKRVILQDSELELIISWLKSVSRANNLEGYFYLKSFSMIAINSLLKKLENKS